MRYLIVAAVIWGSSFPVITYALRDISPILLLVLRFVLAFLILVPRCRSIEQIRPFFKRDVILISIPSALAFLLQFKAQELTTASKAALYVNSSPVFVAIIASVFHRERFGPRQIAALLTAMAGVVVTSTQLDFSGFSAVNTGDMLCLGVGACWALFIVFSRTIIKRYGSLQLSQGLYLWTAVMALPFLAFENVHFAWTSVPAIVYLAAFTTVGAYYFYLKGAQSVSSLSISIIILIEVIVAFLISHFALGESFSLVETVGVFLVMGGVLMVLKK
jgi:drug/metabolite transporter (DMT)-like permease